MAEPQTIPSKLLALLALMVEARLRTDHHVVAVTQRRPRSSRLVPAERFTTGFAVPICFQVEAQRETAR